MATPFVRKIVGVPVTCCACASLDTWEASFLIAADFRSVKSGSIFRPGTLAAML